MQQSKHAHSKPKKKSFPVWIPAAVVLVLILVAGALFLLMKLRDRLPAEQPAAVPEAVEVTEELPPEPVDMREYSIDLPVSRIDAVNETIESIRSDILSDFNSLYDGSSPALLRTAYIQGTSPDITNFILTVTVNDKLVDRQTYCISNDGELLDSTSVFGGNFAMYLQDFVNLYYFTPDWVFNENGVLILRSDIREVLSPDPSNYPLFLLREDGGADFLLLPDSLTTDEVPLSRDPLEIPAKVRYDHTQAEVLEEIANAEATDAEAPGETLDVGSTGTEAEGETAAVEASETDVLSGEAPTVPSPEEASAEEASAPAQTWTPAAAPADITIDAGPANTDPDPAFLSLAEELNAFAFTADARILAGDLYDVRRLYPDKPMVALTFDDGPNDTSSLDILDCLEKHKVVATFFEVGVNVEKYPQVVQREVEIGCEVGSHTYNHFVLGEQSYDYIVYDRRMCDEVFTAAIGFTPKIVRPPEGNVMGYALAVYSEPLIGWSIDTLDWLYKNTSGNVSTVKKAGNLDGQVILLHSIYPESAASVEPIVEYILEQGYQLVTISELLEYCYRVEPEGHYYYAYDYFIKGRPDFPDPEPVAEEVQADNAELIPEESGDISP